MGSGLASALGVDEPWSGEVDPQPGACPPSNEEFHRGMVLGAPVPGDGRSHLGRQFFVALTWLGTALNKRLLVVRSAKGAWTCGPSIRVRHSVPAGPVVEARKLHRSEFLLGPASLLASTFEQVGK